MDVWETQQAASKDNIASAYPCVVTQKSLSQQWDRFILSDISSLLAMFSKYATWEEGHILEGRGDL